MTHPLLKQQSWIDYLNRKLSTLVSSTSRPFNQLKLPWDSKVEGVYLITALIGKRELPYYVGTTTNMRQRLYRNHLMGPFTNARLKKYLVESGECSDIEDAKKFILTKCQVRWVEIKNYRNRGMLEGYFTALLKPKYGISKEH